MRYAVLCLIIAGQSSPGWSQETQVHIIGTQTNVEARRDFIAGTIIITRKRIDDSGTRTVEELLKREPAITIRDGRIGLLNMPGYTQALIDGHAPPAGISLGDLNLMQVEQIEILKSSSAQFGPFGMAGTVNIISRKARRKTSTTMSTGAGGGSVRSRNLSFSHNQSSAGSPLRFSVELSVDTADPRNERAVRQTIANGGAIEREQWKAVISEQSPAPSVAISSDLTWETTSAGVFNLSPDISRMGGEDGLTESRQQNDGSMLEVRDRTKTTFDSLLVPLKWTFKPAARSRLELSTSAHMSRSVASQIRSDTVSTTGGAVRTSDTHRRTRSHDLDVSYKSNLADGHAVKAGITLDRLVQTARYDHRFEGMPDPALAVLGMHSRLTTRHRRLYLQDEWRISESIAATLGIAGARNSVSMDAGDNVFGTHFRVWSPSLHLSRKMGGNDKRQLRMSLAKSFKAPSDDDLTLRPEINPLAPCSAASVCMANSIDTADTAGNRRLQAERAVALNISYAYGIKEDSQLTFEIFSRRINRKHGAAIGLENVPWSAVPRYISRPTNLGDAQITGANLEMELAMTDLTKNAPEVTLRASLGLANSRVSSLPGPDNHLDKITPWTAKLGGSYAMKAAPLKFDLDANWRPGQWTRTSQSERIYVPRGFECDASVIWTVNPDSRLVLSLESKYPRTRDLINEYEEEPHLIRLYTSERKSARVKIQFETEL